MHALQITTDGFRAKRHRSIDQSADPGGAPPLDIETDRIMLCGSPGMLEDLKNTFEARDFMEGSHSTPGHFVIEKAFVER